MSKKQDKPLYDPIHHDSLGESVWLLDQGENYIFEAPSEDEEGRFIRGLDQRLEYARRLELLWNTHLHVPTGAVEKQLVWPDRHPHTHIDSSGIFECPFGKICEYPDAGKVFDEMLGAIRSAYSVLQDSSRDIDRHVRGLLKNAMKGADGKARERR